MDMAEASGGEIEFHHWSDLPASVKEKILNYLPFSTFRRFMFLNKDCYSLVSTMKYRCHSLEVCDQLSSDWSTEHRVQVAITVSWKGSIFDDYEYSKFSIEFARDQHGGYYLRRQENATTIYGGHYEEDRYEAALRFFFKLARVLILDRIYVDIDSMKPGIERVLAEQPATMELPCGALDMQVNDPAVFAWFVKHLKPGSPLHVWAYSGGREKYMKKTFVPRGFFDTDLARSAPYLSFAVCSDVIDDQLIRLQAAIIILHAPRITSVGINQLLLQWHEGKRKLDHLEITGIQNVDRTEILRGFNPSQILTGKKLLQVFPDSRPCTVGIYNATGALFLLNIERDKCDFSMLH